MSPLKHYFSLPSATLLLALFTCVLRVTALPATFQQADKVPCQNPTRHKDAKGDVEYLCPPVIVSDQSELIVGVGSNVTLLCTARGSQPITFVWFQDQKNITSRSTANSPAAASNEQPPSTKLLEERRFEIAEEAGTANFTTSILYLIDLKITDTSLFICWAENPVGYAIGNISVVVNDSPPAQLTGGGLANGGLGNSLARFLGLDSDANATQTTIVSIGFLLFLIVTIVCLYMFKQLARTRTISNNKETSPTTFAVNDLDAFIEQMRSGIISMEYHSMSPIQYDIINKYNKY